MLAVSMGKEELEGLMPEAVSLAAVNGPMSCVVSGAAPVIEAFESRLLGLSVKCRRLRVSHAFHSEIMRSVSVRFAASRGDISLQSPRAPYLSNLTGDWIKAEEATSPDYWANHLRHTVRFSANVQELLKMPANQVILEVGPGQTLGALARRSITERDG